MQFGHVLLATIGLLLTERRVSYRRLKREFELSDDDLDALRFELIQVKRLAADDSDESLVWIGSDQPQPSPVGLPIAASPAAKRSATKHRKPRSASVPRASGSDVITLPVAAPPGNVERRQLTVMFCDLVGSTALSAKLDPEELREVILAYQEACTQVIKRFDGFVARHLGDGILVYFGYPQAHENDAERAVYSALAIVEQMPEVNARAGHPEAEALAVRIGIATGLVVIGDLVGEGGGEERAAIGETPNLAAHIQAVAEPNSIVIAPATRELVGERFLLEDRGPHALKGLAEPVRLWRVVGQRDPHFEAEDEEAVLQPALVGRDEELGLLRRAWAQSHSGHGEAVLISGEPGIGKSRLASALAAQVRAEGGSCITVRCSPYHTNSALYPAIVHLKHVLRWQMDDDASTRLAKLEQAMSELSAPTSQSVPLLADLLSVALPGGRYPVLAMTPTQQREQTLDLLVAWLLEHAERQPVLQIWEDLHWADPSTLELLRLEIEQSPTAAILNVLTYRNDWSPPWPLRSHMIPITLNRFQPAEIERLVAQRADGKSLPREVLEHIIEKTDGVPLYVEELTKTILSSGSLRMEGDRYVLTGPFSETAIPSSLRDSLMAQLDRVPTIREVAQVASVLGREFAYEMLRAVSSLEETSLQKGLNRLVETELLYQRGRPPNARYMFKHALVHDAAYQSLLRRTRQRYHGRVAALLEAAFPEIVEAQPELVAHHFSEAGCKEQAVPYWYAAGERAAHRSANAETIAHFQRGLQDLALTPETELRATRELDFLKALGPALIATHGYGSAAVKGAYLRAHELCLRIGSKSDLFLVLRGLWNSYLFAADMAAVQDRTTHLLQLAHEIGDTATLVEAHRVAATAAFFAGDFAAADGHATEGLELYDPRQHRLLAFVYGADPGVMSAIFGALSLWMLGYPERARRRIERASAIAKGLSHPHTEGMVMCFRSTHNHWLGDLDGVQIYGSAAVAVASRLTFRQHLLFGTMMNSWALAMNGNPDEGIPKLTSAFHDWRSTWHILEPYFAAILAEALIAANQVAKAICVLGEALAVAEQSGHNLYTAELHRLMGVALQDQAVPDATKQAEQCFRRALALARHQQAKSLELRAATTTAELLQRMDRTEQAVSTLAPVYDWFSEGFDTRDLLRAKRVLDTLVAARGSATAG